MTNGTKWALFDWFAGAFLLVSNLFLDWSIVSSHPIYIAYWVVVWVIGPVVCLIAGLILFNKDIV